MTRAEYLSNSAKLFSINGMILFIANAFIFIGRYNEAVGAYGTTITTYTFYVICVLSFLALNGEGVCYKRHRDFKNKKIINLLKLELVFIFIVRFSKWAIEDAVLEAGLSGGLLVASKLFLGFFNTASSFSFLFMLVSLLYLIRDSENLKVFTVEAVAFFGGFFYAIYRTLSYSVSKYGLTELGEIFIKLFSNETVLQISGIVHYLLFVIMCFVVKHFYNSKVLCEQDEKIKAKKNMLVAPKIYNTDHLGLDTLEDDFLLQQDEEDYTDC